MITVNPADTSQGCASDSPVVKQEGAIASDTQEFSKIQEDSGDGNLGLGTVCGNLGRF